MANMWYYASKNQQKGPVSWEELRSLAQGGELQSKDMVWQEGTPDWIRASQVPGLCNGSSGDNARVRADEPAPRRRSVADDRDFERGPRTRKPAKSSKGLIIGLCVGGGALLVIGIVVTIIIIANSGGDKKGIAPPPGPVVGPPGKIDPFGKPIIDKGGGVAGGLILPTPFGARVNGFIAPTDPIDRGPIALGGHCKTYPVQMVAGKMYTIEYNRTGGGAGPMDPFLRLENPGGTEVAADDDGGGGLNSRIVHRADQSGTYRIICTTLGPNQSFNFELIVREN